MWGVQEKHQKGKIQESFMNNKVKVTGNRIRAFKFEERFKGHKNIPSTHFLKRDLGDYNQEHRRR